MINQALIGVQMSFYHHTDTEIAEILASRIKQYRLENSQRSLTQKEMGERTGLSRDTIQRLEKSGRVSVPVLIAVLRELGLLDNLEILVPEKPPVSPIAVVRQQENMKSKRQRARKKMARVMNNGQ